MSIPAIAAELGVAGPTVAYHRSRLETAPAAPSKPASPPDASFDRSDAIRLVGTRDAVARMLAAGLSQGEISRRLGVSQSTVSYHARRLTGVRDERCARRYDWAAIQAFHDEGHTAAECRAAFGFSSASWHDAVKRGALKPRPLAMAIEELCVKGVPRGRHNLKLRLVKAGLKDSRCETCGIDSWNGQPLTLALHHVNGDRHDNRLENLQLLCPNCHAQTDTYAGRRRKGPPTPP